MLVGAKALSRNCSLGRRNNRKFVSIPMRKIVDDLTAKLAKAGISVLETEESYTSKASFIDNDVLPVYDKQKPRKHVFSGVRKTLRRVRLERGCAYQCRLKWCL